MKMVKVKVKVKVKVMMMVVNAIAAMIIIEGKKAEGLWCVARSGARDEELQRGLDYACAAGADCNPIKGENGLCFLPNTLQAHASYAFNSFFQRSHASPLACDFSGTATLARTDPSYGSCVYPSSPRTAGSITSTNGGTPTGSTSPTSTTSPVTIDGNGSGSGSGSGLNPNTMGPPIPTTDDSASIGISAAYTLLLFGMSMFMLL